MQPVYETYGIGKRNRQMRMDGTRQHFDRIEIVRRANLPPLFSRNEGKMRMGAAAHTHTHSHISPTRRVGAQNEFAVYEYLGRVNAAA